MTKEQHDYLLKKANEEGLLVTSYGDNYSGRGMFGKTTWALVCEHGYDIETLEDFWREKLAEEGCSTRGVRFSSDNLGLQFVVY